MGVFTPTLLTIFGVIMYVRLGWVVGNAGLGGAWLVMGLCILITTATSLSLASIATNTRMGPGGAYAILTRSLGLEVGGSIGASLFFGRVLGTAMHVIGVREGWLWIFPDHPPLLVDLITFVVLTGISYASANLAFRVQFLIMAVIGASLVSIFASDVTTNPVADITWWGTYPGSAETGFRGTNFWGVFAVFFPATTGILAGANMSGDLKDPRTAIPKGTLWAVGISSLVYAGLALWCARAGTMHELVTNYNLTIEKSMWPPLVVGGLLGAAASTALAGLIDSPRILAAIAHNRILPYSDVLGKTTPDGNPRAAILVTAIITLAFIMLRDLNLVASLVTMLFLITYGMLNIVVLIEGRLGLLSFRPTLRIPMLVPLIGFTGTVFSIFIVNPTFGLIAVGLVTAVYIWIRRRGRPTQTEDVRSSVFVAVAQWAASRVTDREHENKRAWKPNMLIPVRQPEQVAGQFYLFLDLAQPDGSLALLGLDAANDPKAMRRRLVAYSEAFRRARVHSSVAVLRSDEGDHAIIAALEALQAAFFRPNVLLLNLGASPDDDPVRDLPTFARSAHTVKVGMLVVAMHPLAGLGQRRKVNLWVRPAPGTWDAEAAFSSGNLNLNLLTGYRLMRRWDADVEIFTVIDNVANEDAAHGFQDQLCDLARFPSDVERRVVVADFEHALEAERTADVNVIGLPPNCEAAYLRKLVQLARSTCIFVADSGRESALV